MMNAAFSGRLFLALLLLVVAVVFYQYNVWTPMRSDDYWVGLTFGQLADGSHGCTQERISSVWEWVQACYHRRFVFNGRLSDCIASALLLLGGKSFFNVANTVVFIAAVSAVCLFSFRKLSCLHFCVTLLGMLCFLPKLEGSLLWLCGSCNYLWPTLLLLCIFAFLRMGDAGRAEGLGLKTACAVCAFFCGWWHEGLGATLCVSLFLLIALRLFRRKPIPVVYPLVMLCAACGTLMVVTSPALWERAGLTGQEVSWPSLVQLLSRVYGCVKSLLLASGWQMLVAVLLMWRNPRSAAASPLGAFIVANSALSLVYGQGWGGGYYYLNLGLLLYVLQELRGVPERFSRCVLPVSALACLLMAMLPAKRAHHIHALYSGALRAAGASGGEVIELDVSAFGPALPLPLSQSLPTITSHPILVSSVYAWLGCEPFRVYYRSCDKALIQPEAFAADPTDEYVLRKLNGHYVLRFPLGEVAVQHANCRSRRDAAGEKADTLKLAQRWLAWGWEYRLLAPFMNLSLEEMDADYRDGYHYLVLPATIEQYERLSFTSSQRGEVEIGIRQAVVGGGH